MPQPTATWDIEVLGCPDAQNYAATQASLNRRGSPIDGSIRLRRVQQEGLLSLDLRVHQTQTEYEAFLDFYFNDLNAGEAWFFMPLLVGLTPVSLVCNIRDGFQQERNDTVHGQYLVSFQVDAVRKVSTTYVPTPLDFVDPGGPDNPNLGILDVIDPGGPDNGNLGTLDIIDGNAQVGLPSP